MPGPILHLTFGLEVSQKLPFQQRELIKREFNAFRWGVQGADLLYYPDRSAYGDVFGNAGLAFHLLRTDALFEEMRRYLVKEKENGEASSDRLMAYSLGFICHYCLDHVMHAYVFPKEKEYRIKFPQYDEKKEGGLHGRIENGISWLMYQMKKRPEDSMDSLMSGYTIDAEFKGQLVRFYTCLSDTLYGMDISNAPFEACFEGAFRAFCARLCEQDVFLEDQLNLKRRQWEIFDSPGEYLCYTIPELYDRGVSKAVFLIGEFADAVRQDRPFQGEISRNHSYWKFDHPEWFRKMYNF